jgi:hypothetical protein
MDIVNAHVSPIVRHLYQISLIFPPESRFGFVLNGPGPSYGQPEDSRRLKPVLKVQILAL